MKRARVVERCLFSVTALIFMGIVACHAGERQDITVDAIVSQTNGERAERDIGVLEGNSILNRVAQKRLEDMLVNRYFGHTSPSGQDVTDIAESLNYEYSYIGENLAKGNFKSAADLVGLWMKSPQHRKNLLSRDFREIGVAVALERVDGRNFWHAVQVLGSLYHPAAAR